MTNQEAFTGVCEHLMKQGCQALYNGCCVFRTDSGLRCAIGGIIPKNQYRIEMEGAAIRELIDPGHECFVPALAGLAWDLLSDLQTVHDICEVGAWPKQLQSVGLAHNFDLPACITN